MKRSLVNYIPPALSLLTVIMFSSCANIIPPGGGPRDSLPPKLVMAMPKDSALNTTAKNITLTFDEYVTIQGVLQTLIVSPNMKRSPQVDSKLRNVTIRIMDSLEANTTYSFDFGDAIRDVNEGNIAKGFTYAFSTGKTLDNHTYSGKVILAETGKIDSTIIVVLHRNLSDTAIYKERPRYYTRLNGKGEFSFKHLPAGTFHVYAIMPSFQQNYVDSSTYFSFKTTPLITGKDKQTDTLYAYAPLKKVIPVAPAAIVKLPGSNKEDKRLRYAANFDNGQQDLLKNAVFTFNRKLASFDSTKVNLYDTNYHKLTGYSVSLDTGKTLLTIHYLWKENTPLRLVIQKDAVADTAGITLAKADTLRFFTKKEVDYGSVRLRFANLDLSKNPVLQIVTGEKIVESVPLTETEFRRKLFYAGSYDLRILYDINGNGKWDPGNFAEKRQPEIVYLIAKPITIRPNWDNEVNILL